MHMGHHLCTSSLLWSNQNFHNPNGGVVINSVASHRITGLVGLVRSGSHNISFITWSAIRWANPDAVTSVVATPAWLQLLCSAAQRTSAVLPWSLQVGFMKFSVVLVDCSRLKKEAEKNYHAEWSVLDMVRCKLILPVLLHLYMCPYVPINRGARNTQHSRLIYYTARLHFNLICERLGAHYSCTKSFMVSSRKSWGYHRLWHGVRRHVVQIHCKFGLDTKASTATWNIFNKCLND